MTADGARFPREDSTQRLEILLADYQTCREDDRVQLATVAAIIGVLVTVIGLMAAAVTQTCEFSHSKTCIAAPDYVLAGSPMIPIALLCYAIYFSVAGTIRTYYMRGLENEIRNYVSAPIASLGDLMPASYLGIALEATSLRRGRFAYRLITNLILVVIFLVFGGYTAYVGFHVEALYQIFMGVVYSSIAILLVWQVAQVSIGGRAYFVDAGRGFLNNRSWRTLPTVRAGEDSGAARERSLLAYLIFPRPEDWTKWLIAPGVFLAVAWSLSDLSRWLVFTELWLILEYLIYEARYQWNDARGIDEDPLHGERKARGRLPVGPAGRTGRNILISLAVATARLALALVIGEALGLLRPVLVLMALVLSIAIVYEMLRSLPPPSDLTRPTPAVVAIWCIVGLGYGVRAGLGLIAGGLSATNELTWIGISCFVLFGIMFVLLTWVLEAASSCYYKKSDGIWLAKAKAVLKPHLIALLRYVPIDLKGQGHDAYSTEEDGSDLPVLIERGRMLTPWNLALWASAGLGGALGAGLAHVVPQHQPEIIAASVSLAAAILLTCCNSQRIRLAVAGITACVLVGAISPISPWPFSLLAAGPWIAIASLYIMFRGSSYRNLKEFGPKLLKTISPPRIFLGLGGSLLHTVIGNRAWLAAGFGNNGKALSAASKRSSHNISSPRP